MEIEFTSRAQATLISIKGSIDALTSPQLSEFFKARLAAGQIKLVVDLSQVVEMSSAGLRVILVALKECRQAGGDLRLAAPRPEIEKTLKLAGFPSILQMFSSTEPALASFQ